MRALVFLLILGNLLFFAYARGYFGQSVHPDGERVKQQLQPEKVIVVARGDGPPVTARLAATAPRRDADMTCLQWEGLGERDAEKLVAVSAALPGAQPMQRETDQLTRTRHWVRIAPLATRALAERKAAEATKMGVLNHEVVADGDGWALSMGLFSTREAAENHLAALRKQGIRSAALGERTDVQTRVRVVWRGPTGEAEALRQALKAVPVACAAGTTGGASANLSASAVPSATAGGAGQ